MEPSDFETVWNKYKDAVKELHALEEKLQAAREKYVDAQRELNTYVVKK
jgi:hypothetical protein